MKSTTVKLVNRRLRLVSPRSAVGLLRPDNSLPIPVSQQGLQW